MLTKNKQTIEGIVRNTLKDLGYYSIVFKQEHNELCFVIADGNMRHIIAQVKIDSVNLTAAEKNAIKTRAIAENKEPWAVYVKLEDGVEIVKWQNLSK